MRHIVFVTFDQALLLDIAGAFQVFATARDIALARGLGDPYRLLLVSSRGGRSETSTGLAVHTTAIAALKDEPIDTLIVVGGMGSRQAVGDPALTRWIAALAPRARRVCSVCTGAFLLAAAGLLDGRRVATHWWAWRELQQRYLKLRVDPDPIFLRDGKYWTSAGITAGIDLALALVEADLGRETALAVARQLVVFLKRPGGQAQFSATLALQHGDARFERLHAWIAENLGGDLSLPSLAHAAGMSERSFVRHYRQATGITPARAVEQIRVEAARRMLELRGPVKRVAVRCGFGSEETMRRSFLRLLGATPQAYRERFSAMAA
jgi:transcriptional regulator GlxA family with amidase domain